MSEMDKASLPTCLYTIYDKTGGKFHLNLPITAMKSPRFYKYYPRYRKNN